VNRKRLSIVEGLAGITFVGLGLWGLLTQENSFLFNFLPKGQLNMIFSAGILPIIYIAIGFKVASEFASIVDDMMCEAVCHGGEK
jgi:multicomponent Na+:H+ antiporter subunit B